MTDFKQTCPIPIQHYPHVTMAHGGGGRLMNQLIEKMFAAAFPIEPGRERHDSATIRVTTPRLAVTTDSFVVHPLFFPGGDIGRLAVFGTVNDLAMSGATPLYLTVGFIIEEGLPMETLWRVVCSMRDAASEAGVQIVTGDTKVVDRGKGDGIYINTTGVGELRSDRTLSPAQLREGDVVLINGDIGRHGMAVMAVREGLQFESAIESDCAPLAGLVLPLLEAGLDVHCMRDCTRGGLASVLVEMAESAGLTVRIQEELIPVREDVRGACEILGFDPLYVANEGRCAIFLPADQSEKALSILHAHPHGRSAVRIGELTEESGAMVILKSRIGANRIVDMLSGEQLPRIC